MTGELEAFFRRRLQTWKDEGAARMFVVGLPSRPNDWIREAFVTPGTRPRWEVELLEDLKRFDRELEP